MKTIINNFKIEPYTFLSNMYPCIVTYNNNKYPSVEHAYQAAKSLDTKEQYKVWCAGTPYEAKKIGKTLTLRSDWEDVKLSIMEDLIHQKFSLPDLEQRLIATGEAELVEGNNWGDYYWGKVDGQGLNWLGKILMNERNFLNNKNPKVNIATSYFYQIRNFKPNMIPVSTALSDPDWYKPPKGKEYFYDKRGIVCGLRYEPLIVQREAQNCLCPCQDRSQAPACSTMIEYEQLLNSLVDKEKTMKAFAYCAQKFRELPFDDGVHDPIIVLMVHEAPDNPCSERYVLQKFFNCKELEYPII